MKQKFFFIFATFAICLTFFAALTTALYAQEFKIFLPLISEPSLRGEVLFHQHQGFFEQSEIMKVDLHTGQLTQLTDNDYQDAFPDWSPDGTQIAFSSWQAGNGALYLMDADGTNVKQLTSTADDDYMGSWSPDGTQIAFTRYISQTPGSIMLLTVDTLTVTEVITDASSPDWSPDGTQLAFTASRNGVRDLYILNLNTRVLQQVTDTSYNDYQPVWSPDGTQLLATAQGHSEGGITELYRINIDGTGQEFLSDHNYSPGAHDWSPDGTKIIYEGATKFSRELIVLRLATGEWESATVPDGPMFDSSSRYSPRWR